MSFLRLMLIFLAFLNSLSHYDSPDLDRLQAESAMKTKGRETSQAYSSSEGAGRPEMRGRAGNLTNHNL